ncbi:WHRN-like protein [Mya arenaria]|uniref:WHRN-like protein n=1 Tax=Mya arenaria TaxID=6604 RepID=A0ABY7FV86_MYAAR|nr:uncharacterized protein LOC128218172 isoform X2 [Mya arenaria]WAR25184.1 WHRN-like protein [Mya arenaria]
MWCIPCKACVGMVTGDKEVVYYQSERPWTWKPLHKSYRKHNTTRKSRYAKMVEHKRSEAVLKNLASELLTTDECNQLKQALHHFRVSSSVPSFCQQLKPIINNTPKLLLLIELSNRMPPSLQEDFHRLCTLQFQNYETYLKLFQSGNKTDTMSRVISQDAAGRLKIIAGGNEKKMMMRYNNQKQAYELRSLPGTSVTSGVYSNGSESDQNSVFEDDAKNLNNGRITPVHLQGKKNVHKVILNRHDDGSLGLGISGGREFGSEITISVIEEGGPAATQGLEIEDKILEVNGHQFNNMTHTEAVMIMRNAWNLIIYVQRQPENVLSDEDVADMVARQHEIQSLELPVFPTTRGRLGCASQRLASQDLIVQNVDENSPAAKAGIQLHDIIYKLDGINVRELTEKQIVMLTNAKRVNLSVKRYVPLTDDGITQDMRHRGRSLTPVKQMQTSTYNRALSSPRSDASRDLSEESRKSAFQLAEPPSPSVFQTTKYITLPPDNTRSHSAGISHTKQRLANKPQHLVYGQRSNKEPNWIITPKQTEHNLRYSRRDNQATFPIHLRSKSAEPLKQHFVTAQDGIQHSGRVSKYIRRSQSPHRNTIARVHHEDNVIRAIQMGLEKRQRAVRVSHYQMPDPADYEWEI